MESYKLVKDTIQFRNLSKTPLFYLNRDKQRSDIIMVGYTVPCDFNPIRPTISEWGYEWESLNSTMGQSHNRPIKEWSDLETFVPPEPFSIGRFESAKHTIKEYKGKYLIGDLGITGFNHVTFLRGFENTLEDIYLDRENIERLLDVVVDFECEIIRQFAECKVHGIAFGDDWGTQRSLMISPVLWEEIFLPKYIKQFQLVHSLGMDVYFHSCGYVYDIIPQLIKAGVDIFNFNQPDLLNIDRLKDDFAGKVNFCCPIDHQRLAINGTKSEIFNYAKKLKDKLGIIKGGFIGFIEYYPSLNMDEEHYKWICEAFETLF